MKLLTNTSAWRQWVKEEEGRFADAVHPQPTQYPCFGYMVLESWGQETLRPMYLYQQQIDEMSLAMKAAAQEIAWVQKLL
jgi:hypothetical protein